jgi:hypothetical protein
MGTAFTDPNASGASVGSTLATTPTSGAARASGASGTTSDPALGDLGDDDDDGTDGDEAGSTSAIRRRRKKRRRCKCFPAAPIATAKKPCYTCHTPDLTPAQIDMYADGHIKVIGQPKQNQLMLGFLAQLEGTSTGAKVLRLIKTLGTGGPVRVIHVDYVSMAAANMPTPSDIASRSSQEKLDKEVLDKAWTCSDEKSQGAAIQWTPNIWSENSTNITPGTPSSSGNIVIYWESTFLEQVVSAPMAENPGSVWIGHELIHAIHFMRGEVLTAYAALDVLNSDGDNEEEMRTIGAYGFSFEEISENRIRDELGVAERYTHAGYLRNGKNVPFVLPQPNK